jgi:hypothetical protein
MFLSLIKPFIIFFISILVAEENVLLVENSYKLPVLEMSGMCLRREEVVIVNDNDNLVHFFKVSNLEKPASRLIDLKKLKGAPLDLKGQWEGISCAEDGRLFLLQESPARVLVITKDLKSVHSINKLVLSVKDKKHLNWKSSSNSSGEGILLLAGGNIIIAKEKNPIQLIEFSKNGSKEINSSFNAITNWSLPLKYLKKVQDISDIYRHSNKGLYLLSDQSRSIIKISGTLPKKGGDFRIEKIWKLPKRIKKPEGFFIDKKGRAVIIVDSKKIRKKGNIFITSKLY